MMNEFKSHIYDPRKRCYVAVDSRDSVTAPAATVFDRAKQLIGYTFIFLMLCAGIVGLYYFAQSHVSTGEMIHTVGSL